MAAQQSSGIHGGISGLPRPAVVVVVELGGRWPAYVQHHTERCDIVAIVQQPDEAAQEFLQRARRALAALECQRRSVPLGVYCLSEAPGTAPRVALAAALLRFLCAADALIVDATAQRPERHHEILAWVGVLVEGLCGSDTAVRVHFSSSLAPAAPQEPEFASVTLARRRGVLRQS